MKKVLAVMLAAIMAVAFAACSTSKTDDGKKESVSDSAAAEVKVDMSAYPSDLNEWTGQNFIDYFKAVGVFKDGNGYETWTQDHATYWPNSPVDECVGCWDDAETVSIMVMTINTKNADSTEEMFNEWKSYIKEHKSLNEEYSGLPIDHLAGNVAFSYSSTTTNDKAYEQMEAAYNQLVKTMGVTPDF